MARRICEWLFLAMLAPQAARAQTMAAWFGQANDYPPPGAGPEYVRYYGPFHAGDTLLVGGLLCYAGLMFGALLLLDGRRVSGWTVGGVLAGVGLALIFNRYIAF